MPNLTPNYGLAKPLDTENYNVGVQNGNMDTIDARLKIHADGIAASATDADLDAYKALVNFVAWTDYAATLKTEAGGTIAGTTITYSRWMRYGKTVFVKVHASTGANAVTNAAILLPTAAAAGGAAGAVRREMGFGSARIVGTGVGAQVGLARMNAGKLSVVCFSDSGAFVDMPANCDFFVDICYEVA